MATTNHTVGYMNRDFDGKYPSSGLIKIEYNDDLAKELRSFYERICDKISTARMSNQLSKRKQTIAIQKNKGIYLDMAKENYMLGIMKVEFEGGELPITPFKVVSISGESFKFFQELTKNGELSDEFQTFKNGGSDFKFVSPEVKKNTRIYDVKEKKLTAHKYEKACAASNLMHALGKYMKDKVTIGTIKGPIIMGEVFLRPSNDNSAYNFQNINLFKVQHGQDTMLEKSCESCERSLKYATGAD